jgi:hypothetical protein
MPGMTPEQKQQMIEFVLKRIRKPNLAIDENTALVSSGLVDSMALGDVLMQLEDVTHMRIPAGKVKPKDMDSISKMFETASRVGKPQK